MNTLNRLGKLEAGAEPDAPPWLPEGFGIEREAERWDGLLDALPLDEADVGALWDGLLRQRFLELRAMARGPDCEPEAFRRHRRWPDNLALVLTRLPPELRPRAAREIAAGSSSPLGRWAWRLAVGQARLPPDVSPEALAVVLHVYLDRGGEVDLLDVACDGCGLARPTRDCRRGGDFFPACPHCGTTEWTWVNQTDGAPWQALARAEPDPDDGGRP